MRAKRQPSPPRPEEDPRAGGSEEVTVRWSPGAAEEPRAAADTPHSDEDLTVTIAASTGAYEPPPRWDPARLPVADPAGYVLAAEVGRGGIGRIIEARDAVLDRRVAIKEQLTPRDGVRFVREALITARLQHPSIVPVYQAARWPSGEPFYAMKLVSGRSLHALVDERATLDERLGLLRHVIVVAEAMAYAHEERVIHRDLKPDNVLIGAFGETVVIDWGLAKELDVPEADALADEAALSQRDGAAASGEAAASRGAGSGSSGPTLTILGAIMGTPAYMAPEQARGEAVDERADVYAIGAILYHVLAGVSPYAGSDEKTLIRAVQTEAPPPLRARQAGIPRDLLAIVDKATARAPEDRYPSAKELSEDLRRFETGRFVAAHHYSRKERIARFLRRYRAPLGVAAAALVVLATAGSLGVARVVEERGRAEQNEAKAVRRADELVLISARAAIDRTPNQTIGWLTALSPSFTAWRSARMIAAEARARGLSIVLRGHEAAVNWILFTRDGRSVVTVGDDHTVRVWDVAHGVGRVFSGHTDEVHQVATSPDGARIATSSLDGTVRVWDLASGASRVFAECGQRTGLPAFSPDSRTVFALCADGTVRAWDLASGRHRASPPHEGPARWIAVSPDGKTIASAGGDRTVRLWAWETGESRVIRGWDAAVLRVVFTSDGSRLVTTSDDGAVSVVDLATLEPRALGRHAGTVNALALSRDDRTVFSGGIDGTIRAFDLATGAERWRVAHRSEVTMIKVTPDDKAIVYGSYEGTAYLRVVDTGEERALLGCHDAATTLDVSPDGERVAVACWDHAVRVFSARTATIASLDAAPIVSAYDRAGDDVVLALADGSVRRVAVPTGAIEILGRHDGRATRLAVARQSGRAATIGDDGTARVWDARGPSPRVFRDVEAELSAVALADDGLRVAWGRKDGTVVLGDVATGSTRAVPAHDGEVAELAFAPSGEVFSGGADGSVLAWNPETAAPRVLARHDGRVLSIALSADGATFASGSVDHMLVLGEGAAGAIAALGSGGQGVMKALFSPSGAALYTLGGENSVRVWDVPGRAPGKTLTGAHASKASAIALSPEGGRLATGGDDRKVGIWDARTGEHRVVTGHTQAVEGVYFTRDGRAVVSVGADRTVRLWRDDLPDDEAGLRAALAGLLPGGSRQGEGLPR